jgi:CheY-like chemotaxis protein
VAHDFNNVLVVIRGHAELMRADQHLSPDHRESCDEIGRAAERAAGLTRQLLLFSRRQVLQFRDVDMNEVVASTVRMLRRVMGENIELHVRYATGPLPLHADPAMIELVLINLAVNARDAMPDGGTLTVTTSSLAREGNSLGVIDVTDTGSGIPPDVLPRVFEPFFTTKDVGKGTGLGLATAFGIVQEHGGSIEVESEVGTGTTFRVLLPITEPKGRSHEEAGTFPVRGGTETVLLVEDERSVRTLMADLLSRLGYHVLQASSGVEGVEVARTHRDRIALVVTDLVMPGPVSGLELGRQLAATHPDVKVVYTSGFSTEVARTETELIEGVNFLAKPFSAWTLARVVRERLDAAS